MDQEGEVHCLLLAIVIRNLHYRLHMMHHVTNAKHAHDQLELVSLPALYDLNLLIRVQHEVTQDDFGLYKDICVKLLLKYLLEQAYLLRGVEPLEIILSLHDKW